MRAKISIIILLITISFSAVFSQEIDDTIVPHKSISRFHLLPIGFSIEQPILNQTTILFDFGAGFSFQYTEINNKIDSNFKLIPYIAIEPRIYTNLNTKNAKGEIIDYNSGSYGAFRLQGGIELESKQWYVQIGPLVGIQRPLWKNGYWNIGIGCGSTFYERDILFGLIGDLKIGLF